MPTDDTNKGGYSTDKYSTQSREYFDNERRKSDEFWKGQEQKRAQSEQMKAEQGKKRAEIEGRLKTARAAVAGKQLEEIPSSRAMSRLGGGKNASTQTDEETPPPEKLGGVLFWMAGGLAIIKDLVVDPATDAVVAFGLGGSAATAGIGAIIGVPIAALAWAVKVGYFVTVWLIMWVYFYFHGGVSTSVKIKRLVIWAIGALTEIFPDLFDLLHMTTVMFFLVAYMENAVRKDNWVGFVARTAVDKYGKMSK